MIDQRRRFDRLMFSTRHLARLTECFGETVHGIAHGPSAAILFGSRAADKESIARAFHAERTPRQPFVQVTANDIDSDWSCTHDVIQQLPGNFLEPRFSAAGLLRSADRGTLYLENVDRLPAAKRDELFVALADQHVYLPSQNRTISIDVQAIASIDLMLVDEDFDFSVVTLIPLNVLSAYLEFFEAYWSADARTLELLANSVPEWSAAWTELCGLKRHRGMLQQRVRSWVDSLLGNWQGHHLDC